MTPMFAVVIPMPPGGLLAALLVCVVVVSLLRVKRAE